MKFLLNLLCCCVLIITVHSSVPKLSRKCKLSDSKCMKIAAQEALPTIASGITELGIEPLDVMFVDKHKIDVAGLKLTIMDAYLKGLKNAIINDISFDMKKYLMKIVYQTDLGMKAKYKSSGVLLIVPINGDGEIGLNLKNLRIEMRIPFDILNDKNGKDNLELTSYQYDYEVTGGIRFNLTNLFDGNTELSNTLLSFMNDNWKSLSVTFGRPMLEKVQKKIFDVIKIYLQSQPLQDYVEV